MEKPWKGHEWGFTKLENLFGWCKELGIKIVTFYSLSLENLKGRPKEEIDFLFLLARKELESILEDESNFVNRDRVQIKFFGNIRLLPQDLQETITKVEEKTKDYSNYHVNLAVAYGGRQEIIDACRKIGTLVSSNKLKPEEIDEAVFVHNLQTNGFPNPDLVLRTGGEKRLSNFLPFQSTYSELMFIDTFWPELTKEEFIRAVSDYSQRQRRFGK
jgi:tritrans,polycis-undecaprenyl-diphosphate synthase [geranylgeranyl-diphosphate specific]